MARQATIRIAAIRRGSQAGKQGGRPPTYTRLRVDPATKAWDFPRLVAELRTVVEVFCGHIKRDAVGPTLRNVIETHFGKGLLPKTPSEPEPPPPNVPPLPRSGEGDRG